MILIGTFKVEAAREIQKRSDDDLSRSLDEKPKYVIKRGSSTYPSELRTGRMKKNKNSFTYRAD